MTDEVSNNDILEKTKDVSRRIQGNYRDREYPYEDMEVLRAQGFHGLWIPKEYGGWGAPLRVVN